MIRRIAAQNPGEQDRLHIPDGLKPIRSHVQLHSGVHACATMQPMNDHDPGLFQSGSVSEGYRRYLQPIAFATWALGLIDFVGGLP
jgi:hypothetical protein